MLYKIIVKGHLPEKLESLFDGLTFEHLVDGNTQISGEIMDQSALYRVLRNINDLGIELILVKKERKYDGKI